eukprot:scaffold153265_cov16-Tisochrysis_lutea.AAC.3
MLLQGREKAVEFVRADPALTQELDQATRVALGTSPGLLGGMGEEEDLEEGQCLRALLCVRGKGWLQVGLHSEQALLRVVSSAQARCCAACIMLPVCISQSLLACSL